VLYRPTCHYAYHPSDSAVISIHELAGRNWQMQDRKRILMDEITSGMDELGVLLGGHKRNAYWYGSQLTIEEARRLVPYNNATSVQVTIAVLAGMVWAMENPDSGLLEPDELDHRRMLEICRPYLGNLVGEYSDWSPLSDRERLFPEDLDMSDPWQFKNVRVI
jgi:homospermidine synthase